MSTRKRNSPISVVSLRLGRWPKAPMTSPPTVSNSSSEKSVSKNSLKASTGVSALTMKSPLGNGLM
ncbi:hypothetical protein D9M71_845310 [compost metagenome]